MRKVCDAISSTAFSKQGLVHNDTIILKQSVIRDRPGREDANSVIDALIDLIKNVGVDGLRDLVCDEALPLIEPIRANDIPMVAARTINFIFAVKLDVQDDLLFNLSAKLECIDLFTRGLVRPM